MKKNKTKGSALILVLIGVMILSLVGIYGLTHSTADLTLARNFVEDKVAFFLASTGSNDGTNRIRWTMDYESINFEHQSGNKYYKSGSITDTAPQNLTGFTTFDPPPPIGTSIEEGGDISASLTGWQLIVSSEVSNRSRGNARKEILAVVVTLAPEY